MAAPDAATSPTGPASWVSGAGSCRRTCGPTISPTSRSRYVTVPHVLVRSGSSADLAERLFDGVRTASTASTLDGLSGPARTAARRDGVLPNLGHRHGDGHASPVVVNVDRPRVGPAPTGHTHDGGGVMTEEHRGTTSAPDRARTARFVIAGVIVAVLVAVALDNGHEVDVGYVAGDVSAPVWVVLVAAAVAGLVIGWLIQHRPGRHH